MLTFLGRYFLIAVFILINTSCAIVLRYPAAAVVYTPSLNFVNLNAIATFTCTPITINATGTTREALPATSTLTITLSGLGSGYAYSSLANCKTGSSTTTTLFMNAGSSSVVFYYRTAAAETLEMKAATTTVTLQPAQSSVTTTLFQTLGQTGPTVITQYEKGQSYPFGVTSDGTRLAIADYQNNRVLIWNTIPTVSSQIPDLVLGQTDLSSTDYPVTTSASNLSGPKSVSICGTKIFVADTDQNRVLVWNTIPTSNGQAANLVLGQPTFLASTSNNGGIISSSLNAPSSVFCDGTHLFVSDTNNSRVLMWNSLPSANYQAADYVLGQPNFTTGTANTGGVLATRLSGPAGIYSDGTRLYIVDMANSRVLVWNTIPTATAQAADLVLGQTNFTNSGLGTTSTQFFFPSNVVKVGTKLYVADPNNHRILGWNALPVSNGQAADFVLGQPTFTANTQNNGGISGSSLSSSSGVGTDGTRLFACDSNNNRTLVWNTAPTATAQAADYVLGQPDLISGFDNNGVVSASVYGRGFSVSNDGTRLFVADTAANRVLIWNSLPTSNSQPADLVLGQATFATRTANYGGLSASSMSMPYSVFSDGTRLFLADLSNNRVLIWNSMPTVNNQPADVVLGQPNFVSNSSNNPSLSASSLYQPGGVYSDGTKLFVADANNNRVLVWNTMPSTNGAAASFALGQPNLTSNTGNNPSLSASSLSMPYGVGGNGTAVFVADTVNRRVLIWNATPTVSGQAANIVLGQPNFTSNTSNNPSLSASSMSSCYGIHWTGSQLLVADSSNNRVLGWNSLPVSNGQAADFVVGQTNFTSNSVNYAGVASTGLNAPNSVSGDGTRIFIQDSYNYRTLIVPVPGI